MNHKLVKCLVSIRVMKRIDSETPEIQKANKYLDSLWREKALNPGPEEERTFHALFAGLERFFFVSTALSFRIGETLNNRALSPQDTGKSPLAMAWRYLAFRNVFLTSLTTFRRCTIISPFFLARSFTKRGWINLPGTTDPDRMDLETRYLGPMQRILPDWLQNPAWSSFVRTVAPPTPPVICYSTACHKLFSFLCVWWITLNRDQIPRARWWVFRGDSRWGPLSACGCGRAEIKSSPPEIQSVIRYKKDITLLKEEKTWFQGWKQTPVVVCAGPLIVRLVLLFLGGLSPIINESCFIFQMHRATRTFPIMQVLSSTPYYYLA